MGDASSSVPVTFGLIGSPLGDNRNSASPASLDRLTDGDADQKAPRESGVSALAKPKQTSLVTLTGLVGLAQQA